MFKSLKYISFAVFSFSASIVSTEEVTNSLLMIGPSVSVVGTQDPQSIYENSLPNQKAGEFLLLEACTIKHVRFDEEPGTGNFLLIVTEGPLVGAKLDIAAHSLRISLSAYGTSRRYFEPEFDLARPTHLNRTTPSRTQTDIMHLSYRLHRGGALSLNDYRSIEQEITLLNDDQMASVIQFIDEYQMTQCATH